MNGREHWATRVGLILAVAGSAVGLGNFLRFPGQAASHGGGAFMIPYFVALVFLGIPLMWVEWAMGRFGGVRGHGTAPGVFKLMSSCRVSKYLGVFGLAFPLIVLIYYTYVESWTLAYSYFSLTGAYAGLDTREQMGNFLNKYLGTIGGTPSIADCRTAYVFLGVTLFMNFIVIYRGVTRGIELLAKIAMPTLFLFAVVLVIRVFTLGAPDPSHPERNVVNGLAFLWNPNFKHLGRIEVWLAAAGQVFFTLSVGFGVILTYASYLRKRDDIVLSGLTTAVTNEFAEVVLGGSLAIPLAFMFFGPVMLHEIASKSIFDLGFMSLPIIFNHLPVGAVLGALWFGLLFFAGITSSVSLAQPAVAFLEDELGMSRQAASIVLFILVAVAIQPVVLGPGYLDELDFWAVNVGIVLFAMIEIVMFSWIFGMKRGWQELNLGADIRVPRCFYYILKYITPAYMLALLVGWIAQEGMDVITMANVPSNQIVWKWGARFFILGLMVLLLVLIGFSKRLGKEVVSDA